MSRSKFYSSASLELLGILSVLFCCSSDSETICSLGWKLVAHRFWSAFD
jgi:hypothetical protein